MRQQRIGNAFETKTKVNRYSPRFYRRKRRLPRDVIATLNVNSNE